MFKIRNGCFETNSSSSHSIALSKKVRGFNYDLPVDEDGVLTIPFGEFGWSANLLKTPIEKLSYYITDNLPWDDLGIDYDYWMIDLKNIGDSWDEVCEKLKETEAFSKMISKIKSCCPEVKSVEFEQNRCGEYPFGYVDHQSCGTSHEDDISFEDLIFNNSSIIIIDNDNSCYFEDWDNEDLFDKEW